MAVRKKAGVTFRRGWEAEMFSTPEAKRLVTSVTKHVTEVAVANAPERRSKTHWNRIKVHLTPSVFKDAKGWFGRVIVEANHLVRHALLMERGWDRKRRPFGRRRANSQARWWLRKALRKAAVI